jgi:diadenylate cyclase
VIKTFKNLLNEIFIFQKKIKMDEEVKKEVKEVQQTIIPIDNTKEVKVSEEELFSVLKMISPGTNLRAGLDGILKAGKGALIAVENQFLEPLIDGGFKINCRFTAQKLVELSKMDGAIVLSQDIKKINYANVLLTPDSATKTSETGTRHKAAERTAKQTGGLVIAISERKNEINIFYKNIKHYLKDTNELLRKVNEHIQLLEKQKELFENYIDRLNKMELRSTLSLNQAIQVVQKGIIIQKISKDIRKHMIELGNEGTLLKTRFKEILSGVEKETNLVVKDYTKLNLKKSKLLLDGLTYDEILDRENIYKILGYTGQKKADVIKGWRLLSKTSLHEDEIAKLVVEAGNFGKIIEGEIEFARVLGQEKAETFKGELEKIKILSFVI